MNVYAKLKSLLADTDLPDRIKHPKDRAGLSAIGRIYFKIKNPEVKKILLGEGVRIYLDPPNGAIAPKQKLSAKFGGYRGKI